MEEYVCLSIQGKDGESPGDLNRRLIAFWSHMLRNRPTEYELVYAETTEFRKTPHSVSRQYLVATGVISTILSELTSLGVGYEPVDHDDIYSKYEATSPEWFQIEH